MTTKWVELEASYKPVACCTLFTIAETNSSAHEMCPFHKLATTNQIEDEELSPLGDNLHVPDFLKLVGVDVARFHRQYLMFLSYKHSATAATFYTHTTKQCRKL